MKRQVTSLSALSLLCLLPACIPTGAAGLPMAMLAMEAADGMGMLDEVDLVPDPDMNPALMRHPALADARFSAYQSRLIERHTEFSADPEARLSTEAALDCDLAEDARWLIAQQMTAQKYDKMMGSLSGALATDSIDAALLEGECVEGWPEGEFVAVGELITSQRNELTEQPIVRRDRRRVQGIMRSGNFTGEVTVDGLLAGGNRNQGSWVSYTTHSLYDYKDGTDFPEGLSITYITDHQDGYYSSITTVMTKALSPRDQQITTYRGDMLETEWTTHDGKEHGWKVRHPVETVLGSPVPGQRQCYQHGKLAPDAACSGPTASLVVEQARIME